MDYPFEKGLLVGSLLLLVSILASKTSGRLGVPVLVVFLGIGMLVGSGGVALVPFYAPQVAQGLGAVSLAIILFAGGLETKWDSVRPVLARGISLSTLGVGVTAFLVGLFVCWLTEFTLLEGLLLGAIVSSTDAAAVFSVLRLKGLGLKRHLRPTLELESGSNDPMAYLLTISGLELLTHPETSALTLVPVFIRHMLLGVTIGVGLGKGAGWLFSQVRLVYQGLYPVLALSLTLFTYAVTSTLGGNGFLAVYLLGIVLGNGSLVHKRQLMQFFDGFAWLMQIVMFITLGLLVAPQDLLPVAGTGLLIAAFLILIARPVTVFISLAFFRLSIGEKVFLSWVGLRGAVPIVFATYPLLAGVAKAEVIFNLVFFIVITSVLLQGTTLPLVARWAGVGVSERSRWQYPLLLELSDEEKENVLAFEVLPNSPLAGTSAETLPLPETALLIRIKREGRFLLPQPGTRIQAGDRLLVLLANEADREQAQLLLGNSLSRVASS
jgi:cell volume regulation protein A